MTTDDALDRVGWTYRRGEFLAVLGSDLAVVLPPEETAQAALLWQLLDDGAELEETLDALLATGLSELSGLAVLAWHPGARVTVVLRGHDLRVEVRSHEGTVVVDGAAALTWVERSFENAEHVAVRCVTPGAGPEPGGTAPREIDLGLVRIASLERSTTGTTDSDAARGPAPEAAVPLASGPAEPPQPGAASFVPPPTGPPSPAGPPGWPVGVGTAPDAGSDPAAAPQEVADADRDRPTSTGAEAVSEQTAPGGDDGAGADLGHPVARLVISDGQVVDVDRVVLVGRAPEAHRLGVVDQPRLVTVPSPLHEISSTHLEIRAGAGAEDGSALVTDLGSTNGTVLEQPGLEPEVLCAGAPVRLVTGAVINLGDGVSIQVERT